MRISVERAGRMVDVIDTWPTDEKLTWEAFIQACKGRLNYSYSRQALSRNWLIAEAFKRNKLRLKEANRTLSLKGLTLHKAGERIQRLEQENRALMSTNQALLEQFVRWAYNAANRGLSEEYLSQPLPDADRNPSISN